MAATVTSGGLLINSGPVGPAIRVSQATLVADTSYPTGGYAVTAAQVGLSSLSAVLCQVVGGAANNAAVSATYNAATGKVQFWVTGGTSPVTLSEAAAAANLSGLTVNLVCFGY